MDPQLVSVNETVPSVIIRAELMVTIGQMCIAEHITGITSG